MKAASAKAECTNAFLDDSPEVFTHYKVGKKISVSALEKLGDLSTYSTVYPRIQKAKNRVLLLKI